MYHSTTLATTGQRRESAAVSKVTRFLSIRWLSEGIGFPNKDEDKAKVAAEIQSSGGAYLRNTEQFRDEGT